MFPQHPQNSVIPTLSQADDWDAGVAASGPVGRLCGGDLLCSMLLLPKNLCTMFHAEHLNHVSLVLPKEQASAEREES